ncbi:hypothetical protein [Flavobacterium stagni]|uniref:Uncharacterized protein n=1 Tax=Flavobacterium stagni TaxID=2506421 RepID=A0A4Q1K2E7_9FLAO|nr:hypothetical protein [Flavobacterium stagni]RXR18879.1 hypothetical protein EQG61_13555 [Flavobacterium stagni]
MNKNLIFLLVLFTSKTLIAQDKLRITYVGFFQDCLENWPQLKFEITNLTNDTLYISYDKIKFEVKKKSKKIVEEKYTANTGLPFIRPIITECPEQQIERNVLAHKFAKKLLEKNKVSGVDEKNAIQNIEIACIVIYPNERLYLYKTFFCKKFDKKYEVTVKSYDDTIITSYQSN